MDILLDIPLIDSLDLAVVLGLLAKAAFICVIGTSICIELSLMPAVVRHRIALGTVLSLALLPVLSWSFLSWELAVLPRHAVDDDTLGLAYGPVLVFVYLIVAFLMLCKLAFDVVRTWSLGVRSSSAGLQWIDGLDPGCDLGKVDVRISEHIHTPLTFGWAKPRILLPRDSHGWSRADMQMVLWHELSHIERGDWIQHVLLRLVRSLYWPVPGMGLLARQLSLSSEQACDDRVLAAGVAAPDYAAMLLRRARGDNNLPASVSLGHDSELGVRIRYMVVDISDHSVSASGAGAIFTCAVALSIPLATLQFAPRPELPIPPWGIEVGGKALSTPSPYPGRLQFDESVTRALEPGPKRPDKPPQIQKPPDAMWRHEKPTIPPP